MNNKVSIICPVFNGAEVIERNIESVLNQTYSNIELIVVDGASKDNTVDILEKYAGQIKFISEKDKGIYDAMNKGIEMSTGDWLLFMGADDRLYAPDTLEMIFRHADYAPYDAILGKTKVGECSVFYSNLSRKVLFYNSIHHQGIFYARRLFETFRYNINLTSNSEYELHLKMFLTKVNVLYLDVFFVNFSLGGLSSQAKYAGYKQEMLVRNKLIKKLALRYSLNLLTLCRFLLKRGLMLVHINLHVYSKKK